MTRRIGNVLPTACALLVISGTVAGSESRTFAKPEVGGVRLGSCLADSRGCGKPAATAWCRSVGFQRATEWQIEKGLGAKEPTLLLDSGVKCTGPNCDGFASVTCTRIAPGNDEAPATVQDDPEAYRPTRDFEIARPRKPDPEATRPKSGTEATTGKPDWEAYKPRPDFEIEKTAKVDAEAYKPKPGFEVTKPVDPQRDQENAPPDPKSSERLTPRVQSETGLGLVLGKAPLERRVVVRGPARLLEQGRWSVVDEKTKETLAFRPLIPARTTAATFGVDTLRVTANRQAYPAGTLEGIAVTRQENLLYLSEIVRDVAALTPEDRRGLVVQQVTSELREPVFEGPCHKAYDVPVRVSKGTQAVRVKPGETGDLTVGTETYRVNVLKSRYSIPESCPYAFEEPVHDVQYVIWKVERSGIKPKVAVTEGTPDGQ